MREFVKRCLGKAGIGMVRVSPEREVDTLHAVCKNNYFPNIGILDTSVGSKNLGDFIIMESINRELSKLFNNTAYMTSFATHIRTTGEERNLLLEKELLFVCGTNLLNSNMNVHTQWNLRKEDWNYHHKRCVLFGVGWSRYDTAPTEGTKEMLKRVLSDKVLHSVRDEYSREMLNSIGICNVVNTCCPTTWKIKIDSSNSYKKSQVVTTITDYGQDILRDTWMIEYLLEQYEQVHIWIQSIEDLYYIEKLNISDNDKLSFIPPSLVAYKEFLEENWQNLDYIGTRLHAGIYAMQRNIRSLIIGIDNRALEIAKDVKINVLPRQEIENIADFVKRPQPNSLILPEQNIEQWKDTLRKSMNR